MKQYSWKVGGFAYKQDANAVGQELEKLGDNITAEGVINLARNENSILHEMFEWDDTVAAEKYRNQQARWIITNIQVNIIADEERPRQVRAFVTTRKDTFYEPIEKVVKDTDKYALLLERAYKELNAIKLKYSTLIEIQELLKDIPN